MKHQIGYSFGPKSLQTKKQFARHQVFSMRMEVQREVWIGGPHKHHG